MLLLLSDYTIGLPKKNDALTERCCVEFVIEKMMSLLDAFDEFNNCLLGFHIVAYYNEYYPEPKVPEDMWEMYKFQKVIK